MSKNIFFLLFSFLFLNLAFCQEEEETAPHPQEIDSLAQGLEGEGIIIQEVTYEKKRINPLAPSKAAFYSAILPGLGQVYNKRYWKVPIVLGAIGTGVYVYSFNNTEYNRARDAFKRRLAGFTDDEFYDINNDNAVGSAPDISDEALQNAQESSQRDRDLALLISIALYVLNIVDANVDAHLKQYNVDDNLSVDFQPSLNFNPITNRPNYGMALVVKF
ncbi:DUF5683 domain-containing protein [Flagellimonas sp. HMM57]|uniref:DUF5683 domain-containing protein n=1 Tax=unclassified Flagellimonas TaxID=2644544 RepID=UPI0013D822FB|nr:MULTISPECIES: DUF5683 domain-containing protein [unclassified Flagellimonas]UII75287.1 DUF5683 domain-containing protein [Flagellimonas sp. HMM57]